MTAPLVFALVGLAMLFGGLFVGSSVVAIGGVGALLFAMAGVDE